MRCLRNSIPSSYDEGKLFPPQTAANLNGFAVQTDYDAAAEGGKVRVGWNERPQLIGHKPGDSFDITFKGSAVAIQVIAGPKAGIIEHSLEWDRLGGAGFICSRITASRLHLNRIYILRDGLDPEKEHTLTVRISEKRNELSKGNQLPHRLFRPERRPAHTAKCWRGRSLFRRLGWIWAGEIGNQDINKRSGLACGIPRCAGLRRRSIQTDIT